MKREKRKNKIQNLLITLGIAAFSGILAIGANITTIYKQTKAVSYDDSNYQITLTAQELNNYTFTNLKTELLENETYAETFTDSNVAYNQHTYSFDELSTDFLTYTYSNDVIYFYLNYGTETGKIVLKTNETQTDFTNDIIWEIPATAYNTIKTAVQQDITANTPQQTFAQQIINSIKSGLGLIGALAMQFLTGFTTLFYANGALTTFGTWALVFLGVAISFAVVRLVLALIRSNTGV